MDSRKLSGPHATMKNDKWGFTIANFNKMIDFGNDSFALRVYVQQVFFILSRSTRMEGCHLHWSKGRRIVASTKDLGEGFIFRHGCDEEYEGPRAPVEIPEVGSPRTRFIRGCRGKNAVFLLWYRRILWWRMKMDCHDFLEALGLGEFRRQEKSLWGPPNVESLNQGYEVLMHMRKYPWICKVESSYSKFVLDYGGKVRLQRPSCSLDCIFISL